MTTDFSDVLQRIQEKIPVEDITPDVIANWLARHDKRGKTLDRRRLATILSNTFKKERQISISFTQIENFARRKKIKLSENTYGKEYIKWGRNRKPARVIFSKGRIKTWEYI